MSSSSYPADLRHSLIKELQGIGALYQAETTDRGFRVTKDVPVLRVNHLTLQSILPRVWEIVPSGALMVKDMRRNKTVIVIRVVFAVLILYAIFGLMRKTVSAPVLVDDGGTRQASSYPTSRGISRS